MMDGQAADDDIGEVANPVGKIEGPEDDGDDLAGGMSSTTVGRRERKPLNPDLFKKAQAAVRKHKAEEDGSLTDEDPADDLLDTGAPTNQPAAGAGAGAAKPADPPPPAGPDPAAIAMFEQVNLRRADVEEREKRVAEREDRFRDVAERFDTGDSLDVLRDIVKMNLGEGATDEEIAEELAYQVTTMSLKLAGATIDPSNEKHDLRKLKREMRQTKAEKRRMAQREAAEAEAKSRAAKVESAISAVGDEFRAEVAKNPTAFPWLATSDQPERLLWQIIKREHEHSGRILDVLEAAKLADGHIQKETTGYFAKYKNLLQPAPAETPAPKSAPGGPSDRRSRALTNADASEDTSSLPPAETPDRPLTKEERRARTFGKWKDKLKVSDA